MTGSHSPAAPGPQPPDPAAPAPGTPAPDARPEAAGDPAVAPEEAARENSGPGPLRTARRRRDLVAATLIGVLTLVLGFALAVQVRNADEAQVLAGAREEDLVRILDELNLREDRLRQQLSEQRSALQELNGSGSRTGTALEEARRRAQELGILNGTLPAQGPGMTLTIRDPAGDVRVTDLLEVIQELRGAGAETMQVDGVRIGLSSAVTGKAGDLRVDGTALSSPYEFVVIGEPQNMATAMNIPGGVVQLIGGRGGSVQIGQSDLLVVDALRPLDRPQYASPDTE